MTRPVLGTRSTLHRPLQVRAPGGDAWEGDADEERSWPPGMRDIPRPEEQTPCGWSSAEVTYLGRPEEGRTPRQRSGSSKRWRRIRRLMSFPRDPPRGGWGPAGARRRKERNDHKDR